jgi:hypothetical protein
MTGGRDHRKGSLAVAVATLIVLSSCGSGSDQESASSPQSPSANGAELRSLGVHYHPPTGLVAVVAGDVIVPEGRLPQHIVAFGSGPIDAVEEIPPSCSGAVALSDSEVYQALGVDLQYRSLDDSERENRPYMTSWQRAVIELQDCGPLTGTIVATGALIPDDSSPVGFHERATTWRINVALSPQLVGADPTLSLRLFSEFTYDESATDDGSWKQNVDSIALPEPVPGNTTGNTTENATAQPPRNQVFGAPLPRTTIDRPGPNVWDVKVLYATFADGPDDERDINGQLVEIASGLSDYFARQRPDYRLRFDTFGDSLDVQHLPLSVTAEEFRALFTDRGDELEIYMKGEFARAGIPFEFSLPGGSPYGSEKRMYLMFMEGPRGVKFGGDGEFVEYECGRVSELQAGARIVGINLRDNSGAECESLRSFEEDPTANFWFMAYDALRFLTLSLIELPDCDALTQAEIDRPADERLENIVPDNDVVSNEWRIPSSVAEEPLLDPGRATYFQIETGLYRGDRCRDIVYSPFWEPEPPGEPDEAITGSRSTVDRPDDSTLPRLKVFYVIPKNAFDRRIDLRLDEAIASANAWLDDQTGRTLRFDTFDGQVDVTFVELDRHEEEFWSPEFGGEPCDTSLCPSPDVLLSALLERGLVESDELAVILYDGHVSPVNP